MSRTDLRVGIVGATGMVGEVFLQLLQERNFPVGELRLFASANSLGQTRIFRSSAHEILTLHENCFDDLDLVFFSSGEDISREWGPKAVQAGALVVDNSAAFRMHPDKLLIVPEINGHLLPKAGEAALIANPNCSTIQLVQALAPLYRDFGLESVHVATYQAVSGAGKTGQEELALQLKAWAKESRLSDPAPQTNPPTFPQVIAGNCIPQIGSFQPNGFCTEELKIMQESKKILADDSLRISAFTVRVPVWNAHSEAAWVRLKKTATRDQVFASLKSQPGVTVQDHGYPMAFQMNGQDPVAVGRIHQDLDDPQTWIMWIVADNLRKGAALNGIQIAEKVFGS
jgi:aspartate-semialdehyde dehydrogenase